MTKVLRLAVKKEYFEQIKTGSKTEEYREVKEYWTKRLHKKYDKVQITLGYPSSEEKQKILNFKYNGWEIKKITHKQFGDKPISVYAIKLNEKLD